MEKLITKFIIVLFFAQIALFCIAELNYSNAIARAQASEGSDTDIQIAMAMHGFDRIDVMSSVEPNLLEKTQALLNRL